MAGSLGNSGSLGPENPQALRVATPVSSVPAGVRPPRAPADKPVISARALPMVPPVVAFVFKRVAQGAPPRAIGSINRETGANRYNISTVYTVIPSVCEAGCSDHLHKLFGASW